MFKDNLGNFIQKKGLTVYRIAKDTGIPQSVIYAWVNGTNEPISDHMTKLTDYIGCSIDYLRACLKSRSRQYFGQICAPLRQKYLSYVSETAYFFLAAHQICRKILLAPRI